MIEVNTDSHPEEIALHSKSRLLRITFSDGCSFDLPCEYLRIFSPAKEVRTLETPITGKEGVNIIQIDPQGQYAIQLTFDDGHDTGIYSWETLRELGENYQQNWKSYQDRLAELGYEAQPVDQAKRVKLLYFSYLVQKLRKESEEVELPANVETVEALISWLQRYHRDRGYLFASETVRITVNKQFAESFTRLETGDEVAVIPNSPHAPAAP